MVTRQLDECDRRLRAYETQMVAAQKNGAHSSQEAHR